MYYYEPFVENNNKNKVVNKGSVYLCCWLCSIITFITLLSHININNYINNIDNSGSY